ncbi:unnamed protein product, partial [Rotaria sp. Silwood1]
HSEKLQGKQRVLEFGGGPSLWPSFLLAQYFDEIWFCDYSSSNLQFIQEWLDEQPNAHDWKPYFNFLLDIKQGHHHNEAQYEAQLRSALRKGKIFRCDVHDSNLLFLNQRENNPTFDMIFTSACFEAACSTYDILEQTIRQLGKLLKPDGMLLILTYRNASFYISNGHTFPDLPINEEIIREVLAKVKLFTEPIFTSMDVQLDDPVGDNDGLLITYTYRRTV